MTAYEMRISDWSSDVCSSDLVGRDIFRPHRTHRRHRALQVAVIVDESRDVEAQQAVEQVGLGAHFEGVDMLGAVRPDILRCRAARIDPARLIALRIIRIDHPPGRQFIFERTPGRDYGPSRLAGWFEG